VGRKETAIADDNAESCHKCDNYTMLLHFAINFSDHHTPEPDGTNFRGANL
jgi:hypothetical protein